MRDVTGAYAIGLMRLSEFALLCLLLSILVLQQRASLLMPHDRATEPAEQAARQVA